MKFRLIEEKENKKTLDLDEALGLKEDTIKQNGKWVNKGKEGTHGTFRTKKEADAQRKAMFARGFKEELNEARTRKEIVVLQGNYGYGWDDLVEYELTGDVDRDAEIYKEIRQDKKDYAENEPQYSHRTIHRFEKIEKVEEALDKNTDNQKIHIMDNIVDNLVDNLGLFEAIIELNKLGVSEDDLLVLGFDYDTIVDSLDIKEDDSLNEKLTGNEISDFFDKAKRLGVTTVKELGDLLVQEESKGNTEKEKIDAYADSVELGDDTLSNESLKEYYDPTEVITDYFDEYEQKNYGIDEEGYTEDGLERYVHCGWCEEPTPLSDMRKELNLGYICKDCQDALYSRGEKAVYEEDLDEKLIQGKSEETLKKNIATEVKAGKDSKQAYAIAKSIQKKNESFEDEHLGEVTKNEQLQQEINQEEIDVDKVIDLKDKIEDCEDPEEKKKLEEDNEIVDYFDNSVQDEDIIEDDFDEEHIEELTKKAIEESKKHTKEVGTTITENKSIVTPTQEVINESITSNEEIAIDYVSPNAVDANFQTQEVDLNKI